MNHERDIFFHFNRTEQKIIYAMFFLGHVKAYSEFDTIKEKAKIKHDLVLRRSLSSLQSSGFVEIKNHPLDKRKKLYGLTLDGMNLGNTLGFVNRRLNE